ncbi:hypothetical protein [Fibrella arboris]|uniref:hypothetical protein n=1 Tax=Fibrella arboris TaxID=3242486 RepID=UPI003520EC12
MKSVQELNNSKAPIVSIDSSLDQYRGQILFPEKLAKANALLKGVKLPPRKEKQ